MAVTGRGLRQRFSINFFQGPIFVLFSVDGPFGGIYSDQCPGGGV